ncbi:hypothetical protein Atai01_31070 [Amycolatopsis taiwanensis]|uniref:Uncharacterized protein n=1 Tax=Amycolatopsis taiwanensis TaxID=342230 RepID=A0A9W6VCS2_9PSEU|nr:hypothetical protein Atai01_31070 [Amycolatopsis taiwanensis]
MALLELRALALLGELALAQRLPQGLAQVLALLAHALLGELALLAQALGLLAVLALLAQPVVFALTLLTGHAGRRDQVAGCLSVHADPRARGGGLGRGYGRADGHRRDSRRAEDRTKYLTLFHSLTPCSCLARHRRTKSFIVRITVRLDRTMGCTASG